MVAYQKKANVHPPPPVLISKGARPSRTACPNAGTLEAVQYAPTSSSDVCIDPGFPRLFECLASALTVSDVLSDSANYGASESPPPPTHPPPGERPFDTAAYYSAPPGASETKQDLHQEFSNCRNSGVRIILPRRAQVTRNKTGSSKHTSSKTKTLLPGTIPSRMQCFFKKRRFFNGQSPERRNV